MLAQRGDGKDARPMVSCILIALAGLLLGLRLGRGFERAARLRSISQKRALRSRKLPQLLLQVRTPLREGGALP